MDNFNELEGDENLGQNQNRGQGLGRNQKIAVAVLGVLAVAIIITWMAQLKKSINDPFSYSYNPAGTNDNSGTCEGPECQESLKTKDTDKDSLTDWDELNIYETSPYLEDSDSDGLSDKEEIESGTDPNCPAGRDCSALTDTSVGTSAGGENLFDKIAPDLNISGEEEGLSSTQEEDLQKMLGGQGDASVLRKMLIESGMDEEILNQVSDEDLMASYLEVLESQ